MKRHLLVLPTLLALVLAAACGGSDSSTPTAPPSTPPVATTTPTPVPASATPTSTPTVEPTTPTATPTQTPTPTPTPPPTLENLALGVVRVETLVDAGSSLELSGWGSGSIVDETGLILTNYHVLEVHPEAPYDVVGISFTTDPGLAPQRRYFADVVAVDPLLDLAVVKIARDLFGNEVDAETLDLPLVEVGDSSTVKVGDHLNIIGYPAIGAETITFTEGQVSGFLSQEGVDQPRSWIKTDAVFAPGNSGGAAFDTNGRLIGVPTRVTLDTGGSINRVRPVNFASEVVREGRQGEVVVLNPTKQEETPTPIPAGEVSIGNITFGQGATEEGELLDITSEFPTGAQEIHYTFDYAGMRDGYEWLDRWYLDGTVLEEFSSPRDPWDHGESGTLITNISDPAGLQPGTYTLEIYVEGELKNSADVYVGESAPQVEVRNVIFAAGQEDDQPVDISDAFPSGVPEIYAFFDFRGGATAKVFQFKWFRDGQSVYESKEAPWAGGDSGNWWVSIFADNGLRDGKYTVELIFDGDRTATADVVVGDTGQVEAATFTPSAFALDVDADGFPVDVVEVVETPINQLLFFFDFEGMTDGRQWNFVWTRDGELIYDSGEAGWSLGENGTAWVSVFDQNAPLQIGSWTVQVVLEGRVVAQASIDITA